MKSSTKVRRRRSSSSRFVAVGVLLVLIVLLFSRGLFRSPSLLSYYASSSTIPSTTTAAATTVANASPIVPAVNCSRVDPIEPVNIRRMRYCETCGGAAVSNSRNDGGGNDGLDSPPPLSSYAVSLGWWDRRLRNSKNSGDVVPGNPSVDQVQELLASIPANRAFVDVGANVGFMTMFALTHQQQRRRPVYAVEPIGYNIAKLCEGMRANNNGTRTSSNFLLYHAAAGDVVDGRVNITRNADGIGKFDQASLSRGAVKHRDVVTEVVPMITLDALVPPSIPVGLIKIDVQGNEERVIRGMTSLLSRPPDTAPTHVLYEEAPSMIRALKTNTTHIQFLIEKHGYTCRSTGNDKLCQRRRN